MKNPAPTVFGFTLLLASLLVGCNHPATKPRPTSPVTANYTPPDAHAMQREREAYVNTNYERIMKSGRFKDEAQAKAYAAQEWQRNRRPGSDQQNSVIWSSKTASEREQKKFEADLEKMSR